MKATEYPSALELLAAAAQESKAMCERIGEIAPTLARAADACGRALLGGNKILFCGNGGSAAESQHLATEFVVRLSSHRNRAALPALALTTDTSLLTACGNDYGFDRIFVRQVEAHLKEGDVLILLSTSGKSANLLLAAEEARVRKGIVIGFLGETSSPLSALCDHALHMPSSSSQRVQEGHLMVGHLLVELTENRILVAGTEAKR